MKPACLRTCCLLLLFVLLPASEWAASGHIGQDRSNDTGSAGGKAESEPPGATGDSRAADPGRGGDRKRGRKTPASQPARDPLAAARALYVQLPAVDFDDLPFDEFVAWLSRETRVNVTVAWPRLERVGIQRDTPVALHRKDVLLRDVLRAVLDQVGVKRPLGYRAVDNVITISTQAHLNKLLVTKTYDVQDLTVVAPTFEMLWPQDMAVLPPAAGQSVGGLKDADENVRHLVETITNTVYPDTWRAHGGSGTIAFFRGQLVVRNTPEVHQILSGELRPAGR